MASNRNGVVDDADASRTNGGAVVSNPAHASASASAAQTLEDVARDAQAQVEAFLAQEPATERLREVQEQVRVSMGVIDEALEKYGLPELSMAYNGGKDCLVLLILILACLPRHFSSSATTSTTTTTTAETGSSSSSAKSAAGFPTTLQAVYIVSPHPFPEVDAFVGESARRYRLDVVSYTLPMRAALASYLAERARRVRAIFVGTRRTDPHGRFLSHFAPTDVDKGWPDFMRVHPMIDWHYVEIWVFLRALGIPYCSLYDQGYTSLGGMTDTQPNPALRKEGDGFRPAYELFADDEERLGRDR